MKTFRDVPIIALLVTICALVVDLMRPFGLAIRRASHHPLFRPAVAVMAIFVLALLDHRAVLAAPIAIGVLTEGQHTGEFILSEANGTLSRDTVSVTVPANTTIKAGAVLGQISATGKYVSYDDANSDGSEAAAGILYDNVVNATDAPIDVSAVVINKDAEVRSDDLQWGDGVDEEGGLADLLALGIKARD